MPGLRGGASGSSPSRLDIGGTEFRVAILWWLLFTALATWVLLRTRFGNWVFATGGDESAARNVGVPARRTTITLFMTTATAAWFVGTTLAVRLTSVQANTGIGQELIYIVAAVIGGCLLTGGFGSAIGASLGALIFGMTQLGHRRTCTGTPTGSTSSSARCCCSRCWPTGWSAATPRRPGDDRPATAPLLELRDVGKDFGTVRRARRHHHDRARPARSPACSATTAPASRR